MTKRNLALIYGGDSAEVGISILSGRNVSRYIDRSKYKVYQVLLKGASWQVVEASGEATESDPEAGMTVLAQVDKNDFSFTFQGKKRKFDLAMIMIHGTPGENGVLQGYLEMMGVPFTTSSSAVSASAFDKQICKVLLRDCGFKLAPDVCLRKGKGFSVKKIVEKLGLPLFVKPCSGGSSFGVSKVMKEEELEEAVKLAFRHSDTVLVETYISGREITQGAFMDGEKIVALPVTEIIPHNTFFDYEAKYNGLSDEICPADIAPEKVEEISAITRSIYDCLGCRGIVRVDYFLCDDGSVVFLELNTVPGMTAMSLVPQQIRAAGLDMMEVITGIADIT